MEDLHLTTKRLSLRPVRLSDFDVYVELLTDPDVTRHVVGTMTPEAIERNIPIWSRRGGPDGCIGIWCASVKETGEKIGTGALLPLPIEEEDTNWDMVIEGEMPAGDTEIGYILKQSAWGQGYATEICGCLLQFAFERTPLLEVVATFDDANVRSRNVLEKSGFSDKGRRFCYAEDSVDFRITRDEWTAFNGAPG